VLLTNYLHQSNLSKNKILSILGAFRDNIMPYNVVYFIGSSNWPRLECSELEFDLGVSRQLDKHLLSQRSEAETDSKYISNFDC
jgi:hypothetical protein